MTCRGAAGAPLYTPLRPHSATAQMTTDRFTPSNPSHFAPDVRPGKSGGGDSGARLRSAAYAAGRRKGRNSRSSAERPQRGMWGSLIDFSGRGLVFASPRGADSET